LHLLKRLACVGRVNLLPALVDCALCCPDAVTSLGPVPFMLYELLLAALVPFVC